jgi:hypothetical protein
MRILPMPDPVALSISLQDFSGKRKSIIYFMDPTTTAAQAQTAYTATEPKLDAVIDARIVSAHVTLPIALSGSQKGTAIDGNRVREGALLRYSADSTVHPFGLYVPSWKNAGFSGDTPLNTGAYATFISDLLNYSDDDANALVAYLSGERTFRK